MERIKISNFRSVKDSWDLELGPITFFTGKNNSGKSTVLKSLLILSDYIKSNNHLELNFRGEKRSNHKVDCYQSAVNWVNFDNDNQNLEFTYDNEGYRIKIVFKSLFEGSKNKDRLQDGVLESISIKSIKDNNSFRMFHLEGSKYQINVDSKFLEKRMDKSTEIKSLKERKTQIEETIKNIEFQLENTNENEIERKISLKENVAAQNRTFKEVVERTKELMKNNMGFDKNFAINSIFDLKDLRFGHPVFDRIFSFNLMRSIREYEESLDDTNIRKDDFFISEAAYNIANAISFSVEHLSPHRNNQSRLYKLDEISNDINRLASVYIDNPIDRSGDAHQFLVKWMKQFNIGNEYNISLIHGDFIIIEVTDNNRTFNLMEKGFGTGQLFSILLSIALEISKRNDKSRNFHKKSSVHEKEAILMIEEPEANLHPDFQSQLADMFFEANTQHKIRFIIETHSVYILRRTQVIVKNIHANSDTQKQPFKVYYFDKDSPPYQMSYNTDGTFSEDFGKGFYDEFSQLIFDLY